MPRKARIDTPGTLQHVIARGIERCDIFTDDADCDDFLERLGRILMDSQTSCYAWSLVGNHFHLLLKSGSVPIATVMRRLLTGYAIRFNRRHGRTGHLFQNRYKSIICQEDLYLKELMRYIHLNPLRAGIVKGLDELDSHPHSGHSAIMGNRKRKWQSQSVLSALSLFDPWINVAREAYRDYMAAGIDQGKRPDLVGGGLIRSAGGWDAVKSARRQNVVCRGDERILGDGDFVASVLEETRESMGKQSKLKAHGVNIDSLIQLAGRLVSLSSEQILGPNKSRDKVKARRLICYWGTKELCFSMTEMAAVLRISVPTASVAARRGAEIVCKNEYSLPDLLNIKT